MGTSSFVVDDESIAQLMERLVLSYEFYPALGVFEIVTEFWEKPQEGGRTFIRIQFAGVDGFEREAGIQEVLQSFLGVYRPLMKSPSIVVQAIQVRPEGAGRKRVELWFGPSFGGVSFVCGAYLAWTRVTSVRQVGESEWEYRDAETRALLDFRNPFGG